jgi:hypothetical protein
MLTGRMLVSSATATTAGPASGSSTGSSNSFWNCDVVGVTPASSIGSAAGGSSPGEQKSNSNAAVTSTPPMTANLRPLWDGGSGATESDMRLALVAGLARDRKVADSDWPAMLQPW